MIVSVVFVISYQVRISEASVRLLDFAPFVQFAASHCGVSYLHQ